LSSALPFGYSALPPPIEPKKSLTFFVDRVFANALTKAADAFKPAALRTLLILSALTVAPWPDRTKAA
jgi:hypothetical protein